MQIVQTQGRNIRAYAEYLLARAVTFGLKEVDYVRTGEGRLKKLSVANGLVRETEGVQEQVRALVKCDVRDYTKVSSGCERWLTITVSFQRTRERNHSHGV